MLEPLNSLDTDSYIEKVSAPISYPSSFISIGGPVFGPIGNDSIIDVSAIQYGWIYPTYTCLSPSHFSRAIGNTGTVDIHSSFFFVLSPPFPNETRGMSHYDLNCILILSFP